MSRQGQRPVACSAPARAHDGHATDHKDARSHGDGAQLHSLHAHTHTATHTRPHTHGHTHTHTATRAAHTVTHCHTRCHTRSHVGHTCTRASHQREAQTALLLRLRHAEEENLREAHVVVLPPSWQRMVQQSDPHAAPVLAQHEDAVRRRIDDAAVPVAEEPCGRREQLLDDIEVLCEAAAEEAHDLRVHGRCLRRERSCAVVVELVVVGEMGGHERLDVATVVRARRRRGLWGALAVESSNA